MKRRRTGQSTLEYILVVASILAVLIAIVNGVFTTALQSTLDETTSGMIEAVKKVKPGMGL